MSRNRSAHEKSTGKHPRVMASRLLRILAAGILVLMFGSPAARGDGDPASDILLGQNVFYPYTPPVSPGLQKTLTAETAAASRAHFPIKVALIASPVNLGVIPALFGRPQKYAAFLDQEISFQGKRALLVVMRAGYGVQGLTAPATSAAASLPKPAGKQSNDLARAAIAAVPKLAAAAGHPINTAANGPRTSTGNNHTTLLVAILALAAIAAAAALVWLRRRQARHG